MLSSRPLHPRDINNLFLLCPGNSWRPANTLPCRANLIIELINLLQSQTLGLVDHGVHERNAQEAAAEPDEEDLGLQVRVTWPVVDQVGGGVGDGPVEEPVCRSCHGEGLGADLQREDFTSDDPECDC